MRHAALALLLAALAPAAPAADPFAIPKVGITAELPSVEVVHDGKKVTIARNQDPEHTIAPAFALTSRVCPPFCIQPETLAPGVETVGELEVLAALREAAGGDKSVLVIDSRTPDWVARGTIPGAVNIPFTQLNIGQSDPLTVQELLESKLGVKEANGLWDFRGAKTLVLFCNGPWCGQSPMNIQGLLRIGYPAHKLKWYRGGMQDWEMLGLTTVKAGGTGATDGAKP